MTLKNYLFYFNSIDIFIIFLGDCYCLICTEYFNDNIKNIVLLKNIIIIVFKEYIVSKFYFVFMSKKKVFFVMYIFFIKFICVVFYF